MDLLTDLKSFDKILFICEQNDKIIVKEQIVRDLKSFAVISTDELSGIEENSQNAIVLQISESNLNAELLSSLLKVMKSSGKLIISKLVKELDNIEFLLKTNGYINVELNSASNESNIVCTKPAYEVGSTAKLILKKPAENVWKLEMDDENDENDVIDQDNLLDDEDLKKPDPSTLRVCGTTGKRKACKDCSCGLAEELSSEANGGIKVVDTSNQSKSSCGNCYLGDAFRCAACPYLGMPAFKPGEKIQLSDNLLKADV